MSSFGKFLEDMSMSSFGKFLEDMSMSSFGKFLEDVSMSSFGKFLEDMAMSSFGNFLKDMSMSSFRKFLKDMPMSSFGKFLEDMPMDKLMNVDISSQPGPDTHPGEISGSIPEQFAKWRQLRTLNLAGNNLTGTIPPLLLTAPKQLLLIIFNHNQFSGPLPPLEQAVHLQNILLTDNNFSGSIPNAIASLTGLKELMVSRNRLTGTIPESLVACTDITGLQLDGNSFTNEKDTNGESFTGHACYAAATNRTAASITGHTQAGWRQSLESACTHWSVGRVPAAAAASAVAGVHGALRAEANARMRSLAQGKIPPNITKLLQLQTLNLGNNKLTSTIPPGGP
eukprot:gene11722-13840_t